MRLLPLADPWLLTFGIEQPQSAPSDIFTANGTLAATVTHGITLAEGKGGWLLATPVHEYRSAMGQNFSIAIAAWTTAARVCRAWSSVTQARRFVLPRLLISARSA